jgi:hypothetical protein
MSSSTKEITVKSLTRSGRARYTLRKRRLRHHHTRCVPALSTQEAAALVMGVIEAQLQDGWSLEQIGWQGFCRDTAMVEVVTRQLEHHAPITEEV